MAITNATTTSTTNISGLSNGTPAGTLMRLRHWRRSPLLSPAAIKVHIITQGWQQARSISMDEYGASGVSQWTENTALTATALPALLPVSSTLAEYGIAIANTSQVLHTLADRDEYEAKCNAMAIEACLDYMAHGTTNGIAALAANLTPVTTDQNSTAQISTADAIALTLRSTFGASKLIGIYSPKGINDLRNDIDSKGSGSMASEAMSDVVRQILVANEETLGSYDFQFELNGIIFMSTRLAAHIYQTGSNDYAWIMVPAIGQGFEGGDDMLSAIQVGGTDDPCSARKDAQKVADFYGIGISKYAAPVEENAAKDIYCFDFDAWLAHSTAASNPARAHVYASA